MLEENSASKKHRSGNQDISDIQDLSNEEDISNKQVRSWKQNNSRKQVRSRKQDTSSKQDTSNKLKNIGTDCLMEKLSEFYNSGYASIEQSQAGREHARSFWLNC